MSASALLDHLLTAGIAITREGDNLRVRALAGVALAPYLDQVRANKPALLRALLQEQITAALHVEARDFDRSAYEELVTLWKRHSGEEHER
jgi:hypothetical protein